MLSVDMSLPVFIWGRLRSTRKKIMAGKGIIIGAGDLTPGERHLSEDDFAIAVEGGLSYCGFGRWSRIRL